MTNVLVFFMSLNKYLTANMKNDAKAAEEFYYKYMPSIEEEQNDTLELPMANHANLGAAKAVSYYLKGKNQRIDKVIYLASKSVRDSEKGNTEAWFKDQFSSYKKVLWNEETSYEGPTYEGVEVDDEFSDNKIIDKAIELADAVIKNRDSACNREEFHVYIDYSGGIRQAASALLAVGMILELSGIKVSVFTNQYNPREEASYKNKSTPCLVKENENVAGSIEYVNAIQYFMGTGDIRQFHKWLDGNAQIRKEEDAIIKNFEEFYNKIMLCQPDETVKSWGELSKNIKDYKSSSEEKTSTISYVMDLLAEEMNISKTDDQHDVGALIRWCLKHDFIQQAITIFNEKIPGKVLGASKDNLTKEWLNSEDNIRSYFDVYTSIRRFEAGIGEQDYLRKVCNFKKIYLLIEAVRDHANHASDTNQARSTSDENVKLKNRDQVEDFFAVLKEEVDFQKYLVEIDSFHDLMNKNTVIKQIVLDTLDNIESYKTSWKAYKKDKKKMQKDTVKKNSFTIIIPVIYNDKMKHKKLFGAVFDMLRGIASTNNYEWKNFSESVFKRLQKNTFDKKVSWKQIVYDNSKVNRDKEIYVNAAFEVPEGTVADYEEMEREYYYKEMFDTLYDKRYSASKIFMLSEGEQVRFREGYGFPLDIGEGADKVTREISKVYYYLTNANIGLLILEGALEEKVLPELSRTKLKIRGIDIVEFFLGKKDDAKDTLYGFPFNDRCFAAKYECNDSIGAGVEKVISAFTIDGKGSEENMLLFFSNYLQIFWLCVLQKTEIIHISQMAGRISRRKRKQKMKKEIQGVSEEYALFCNQYDLVECTYDEEGDAVYKELQKKMSIIDNKKEVGSQMQALQEYAVLVSGRFTTLLVSIFAILGSVKTLFELKDEGFYDLLWQLWETLCDFAVNYPFGMLFVVVIIGLLIYMNKKSEDKY